MKRWGGTSFLGPGSPPLKSLGTPPENPPPPQLLHVTETRIEAVV